MNRVHAAQYPLHQKVEVSVQRLRWSRRMVSAAGVTLAAMSKIQSDFGSLADRVQTPSGAGQDELSPR